MEESNYIKYRGKCKEFSEEAVRRMKIICVDNFDRDDKCDKLVCENVSEYYGKYMTEFLNNKFSGDYAPDYYRLVEDDYKLYVWEP